MKKLMKSLMLFAAAAMALTSCENEAMNEGIESNNTVTMTITANDATRTFVTENGNKANFGWNAEGEVLRVIEVAGESTSTKQTDTYSLTDRVAEFTVSFTENTEANEFTYYAVYPNANYVENDNKDFAKFKVALPEAQTYTEGSYDANADLMIAKPIVKDAQPTALSMQFTRLAAIGKMTLKGMPEDKNITSLTFTATGKALAGRAYVDLTTGIVSEYGYQGQKEETITLTIAEGDAINNDAVYFTCFPFELAAGETFEVKAVTADKYTYTKTVTLAEGKSLAFSVGNMSAFTVNMSTAEVVAPGKEFTLLTDVSKLHIGDEIIIANTANKFALSTSQGNNNRGQQGVTIENNTITAVEGVAVLTVGKEGANYTLYDPANNGYLFAASSSSNYLRTQENNNANGQWVITVTDAGVATIVAQGSNTRNDMRYNKSSSCFSCYASTSTMDKVSIFLNDIKDSDPVIPTITAETAVALTSEESEGTVTITTQDVEGEVTVTLGDAYDWFLAELDEDDNLYYIASANDTDAIRTATVTLSAEGATDVVITFTQSAPADVIEAITIAEFLEKDVALDTYYELTGKITNIANTTYGNLTIEDATASVYVYGFTATKLVNTSNDKSFASLSLNVGDVVTLHAIRNEHNGSVQAGGTDGGSTSNSYPAYYISHYGFTATAASTSIEATGGNTTITVASTGTLPEAISYTVVGEATVATGENNTYTVTFDENTDDAAREATITLTCGLAKQTVTITQSAPGGDVVAGWVKISALSELAAGDKVALVGTVGTTNYSMKTNGTGSAPTAKTVTINGNTLTSVDGITTFNIGKSGDNYILYEGDATSTWLYCTNTNNGVRSGTNTNKTWVIASHSNSGSNFEFKHVGTSRFLGIYNKADWRCYDAVNAGNFTNGNGTSDIAIYKYVSGETPDPTPEIEISVENQEIANTEGEDTILVTVTNGEGYIFEATTTADWIDVEWNNGVYYFAEANTTNAERTATVEIFATDGENEKTVSFTITQAAGDQSGEGETYTLSYSDVPTTSSAYTTTASSVTATDSSTWEILGYIKQNSYQYIQFGSKSSNYILTPVCTNDISTIELTCTGSYTVALWTVDGTLITGMYAKPAATGSGANETLLFTLPAGHKQVKIISTRTTNGSSITSSNAATYISKIVVNAN